MFMWSFFFLMASEVIFKHLSNRWTQTLFYFRYFWRILYIVNVVSHQKQILKEHILMWIKWEVISFLQTTHWADHSFRFLSDFVAQNWLCIWCEDHWTHKTLHCRAAVCTTNNWNVGRANSTVMLLIVLNLSEMVGPEYLIWLKTWKKAHGL